MTHAFIGRMVLYRLTAKDASATNKRREEARQNVEKMRWRLGLQAHVGTQVSEGERVPMMIVSHTPYEIPNAVNGQAFLDGNDSLWVTTVGEGEEPGQWQAIMDG